MMANTIKILLLFSTLSSFLVSAAPVFRADSRGPDDIFNNGFQSRGENKDLVKHVNGESCSNGPSDDSNFISLTHSESQATEFALSLGGSNLQMSYVYRIYSGHNFYDVIATILAAINTPWYTPQQKRNLRKLITYHEHEEEVFALDNIPAHQIFGVTIFDEQGNEVGQQINPNFVGVVDPNLPIPAYPFENINDLILFFPDESVDDLIESPADYLDGTDFSACYQGGACGSSSSSSSTSLPYCIPLPNNQLPGINRHTEL